MMGVTVPYEATGRTNQKARTRSALIAAVRGLLADGEALTMDAAAEAAAVSRTTAYRYFPSLRALLTAAYPHIEAESLLGEDAPGDPLARLDMVARDQGRRILKYAPEMRAVLRLSLEPGATGAPDLPMNRGLRIGWIEDALAPLRDRMPADAFTQLVHGVGATLGIEAFAWLTDIAGRTPEEAVEIMRTNALGIARAALTA